MEKTTQVLKTLAEAARQIISGGDRRDWEYLETELVRAEDHLLELEEYAWDYEVFVIATRPEIAKIYGGRVYCSEDSARHDCDRINKLGETPCHWKVYRGVMNTKKEAETYNGDTLR